MNRLHAELHRLYLPRDAQPPAGDPGDDVELVDDEGRARALVLALARPASWDALAKVWRGVQAELELPAPAIAVSGVDACQLWFSLSEPVPLAQALAFLEGLRQRWLGDVAPERIGMAPSLDPAPARRIRRVPAVQGSTGHWSAFVSPDLASLFTDEPWLDLAPGDEAQADLLSRIESAQPADFQRALQRLESTGQAGAPVPSQTALALSQAASPANRGTGRPLDSPGAPAPHRQDPRHFLLAVMNDQTVELALRVEAAKALLPWFEGQRPG